MWLNDLTKHSMRPEAELQSPSGSQVMSFSSLAVFGGLFGFFKGFGPHKVHENDTFWASFVFKKFPQVAPTHNCHWTTAQTHSCQVSYIFGILRARCKGFTLM